MNRFKSLMVCLLSGGLLLLTGCNAVDAVVDNSVNEMVAEENKKLPAEISHGIRLVELEYLKDNNQLLIKYSVPNPNFFNTNRSKIESETQDRVNRNVALQRALKNNIQITHQFYRAGTEGELKGDAIASFESGR